MKYELMVRPRIGDFNRNGNLSLEAIIFLLEIAGQCHSDNVMESDAWKQYDNSTWIITEWNIRIANRPCKDETYKMSTWAIDSRPGKAACIVPRAYVIEDSAGDKCILAEAKFVFINRDTGKVFKLTPEMMAEYKPEGRDVVSYEVPKKKVTAPKEFDYERIVNIRREDIDFNGHVHNSKYIVYALEVLPEETYLKDKVTDIHIQYRNPLCEGDLVTAKVVSQQPEEYIVCLYNDKEQLCTIIKIIIEL